MSITTALKARREQLDDREAGFTLIELLVVVIIIGILAAIAIPVYIGVQNNAKNSTAQSDLTNAKTAFVASTTQNGTQPTVLTGLSSLGYSPSTYSSTGAAPTIKSQSNTTGAFCLQATADTGTTYFIGNTGSVSTTTC